MATRAKLPKKPAVSIRGETFDRLRQLAETTGRTMRDLLDEQLVRFLDEQQRAGARRGVSDIGN